tara:strand:+ start:794 stop:1090 length:297 start_codon:yes stop_codon:yes gene_type:complete
MLGEEVCSISKFKAFKTGRPDRNIVENCLANINMSLALTPLPKLNPADFFFSFSTFFFFASISLVIITFCSFNLYAASELLRASISPSTYFPCEIPLY